MSKKLLRFSALTILLALLLLPVTPTLAAPANPDSITLHTVKVFQNIFEANDVLFVMSYDVEYAAEPSEPASDTFQTAIYSVGGTSLIKSRPLEYYQYNVTSIYFNATDAAALLTWESEYWARVMGNPVFFAPAEDTTMDTTVLSAGTHWFSGAMTASRDLLRLHCLTLAALLETDWGITLIVTTPDGQVLNNAGRITFIDAIQGLDTACPTLFQMAVVAEDPTQQTKTDAYQADLTMTSQLGTQITDAFDGIGAYINVSGQAAAGMWIMLFILTVASIVFLNSGNSTAAIVLTIPIMLIGVWVGVIPLALLFTIGAIVVVYTGYHIWLRGM